MYLCELLSCNSWVWAVGSMCWKGKGTAVISIWGITYVHDVLDVRNSSKCSRLRVFCVWMNKHMVYVVGCSVSDRIPTHWVGAVSGWDGKELSEADEKAITQVCVIHVYIVTIYCCMMVLVVISERRFISYVE